MDPIAEESNAQNRWLAMQKNSVWGSRMSNPPRSSMLSQSPDTATHVQYITPQFDPRASYAQSIKNNTWDNSINQGKPQRSAQ
ncbi:unnamed protein product [Didymodactylos carnosus]|uniref:Uncharacterized protein n=1 Tax=Didymodactylos carnosus TaxID=1234261 RepID=A0A8S2TPB0_9BILA|nr:unnamed protein product [Didymodactylos carnosus]